MTVLQDWREYDPSMAEAADDLRNELVRSGLSNRVIVKMLGVVDAMEYRLANAELFSRLAGTGICPHCETCLGCGCSGGPIENHDDDCPVIGDEE